MVVAIAAMSLVALFVGATILLSKTQFKSRTQREIEKIDAELDEIYDAKAELPSDDPHHFTLDAHAMIRVRKRKLLKEGGRNEETRKVIAALEKRLGD